MPIASQAGISRASRASFARDHVKGTDCAWLGESHQPMAKAGPPTGTGSRFSGISARLFQPHGRLGGNIVDGLFKFDIARFDGAIDGQGHALVLRGLAEGVPAV